MEVVAEAMVVTTVCVAAGFVTLRGAGAAAQVLTQMFNSPAHPGWPSGIQEDDDFHWQWSGVATDAAEAARLADEPRTGPEIVELPDGSGPRTVPLARH